MNLVLGYGLIFLLGAIVGAAVAGVVLLTRTVLGNFRIDKSDPEKDVYRLDIDNLDVLSEKKYVLLKIDSNADLSQK